MTDEHQHDQEGKPLPHVIDDVSKYMNELISRGFEGNITKKEMNAGVLRIIDKVLMQMKRDFEEEDERGIEGVVEFSDTIDAANERLELERREPSFGPFKFLEEEPEEEPDLNLQGALNNFNVPQTNQPLFNESELSIQELASPTILPDVRDREIAMRQTGGIGSLV